MYLLDDDETALKVLKPSVTGITIKQSQCSQIKPTLFSNENGMSFRNEIQNKMKVKNEYRHHFNTTNLLMTFQVLR